LTWNQRTCGKRRGPTEEVRQVLGYPFYAPLVVGTTKYSEQNHNPKEKEFELKENSRLK
jgi:hypothetical protein